MPFSDSDISGVIMPSLEAVKKDSLSPVEQVSFIVTDPHRLLLISGTVSLSIRPQESSIQTLRE